MTRVILLRRVLMILTYAALLLCFAMVIAPVVTYLVGRLVPVVSTAQVFRYLGLSRARDMALRLAALEPGERPAALFEHAPRRWLPALLRYRICALMQLFNLPGNALIGGGGGIAFAAGLSRLYHFPSYLLAVAVAVAVAPVPLLFVLMG